MSCNKFYEYSDWSGEPNNSTATTDCVNVNYGGYYEVHECSMKQSFICQRAAVIPPSKNTTTPSIPGTNRPGQTQGNTSAS